jgi:hypothetical protein
MEIYNEEFSSFYFNEETSVIEHHWKETTSELSDEGYKKEMIHYADFVEKYKPAKLLVNAKNLKYGIDPDIQEWVNENIHIRTKKFIGQVAFVMSDDLMAQIGVEQLIEEETYTAHYFDNIEEARSWLEKD